MSTRREARRKATAGRGGAAAADVPGPAPAPGRAVARGLVGWLRKMVKR